MTSDLSADGTARLTTAECSIIVRALRYLANNDFNWISDKSRADPEDVARNERHRAEVTALAGKIHRLYLDMVIRDETPGTATHEQLTKARQAVHEALASAPRPKPTDDA